MNTILIADDNPKIARILSDFVKKEGWRPVVAVNGCEALEMTRSEDPAAVLLDVMMPEMDGYEATALIRQDPRWKKLPIIAVTAKAMKDDQERCLEAGANDYLAKPIELDRLLSLIRVWLPQLERA